MEKKELKQNIKNFLNQKIAILGYDYKGKGRPKKTDYVTLKRKDLRDYEAFCMLRNGFTTQYIKYEND
jgi:hypothetical protein